MKEHYWIFAQKVGTKSLGGKPISVYAIDGVVAYGSHKGEDVKTRVATIVKDLQDSGTYSRVAVKNAESEKRGYIYDWKMEVETLQVMGMGYAEYKRKRNELKAQIKALEAQIAELDKEWYKG